MNQLRTAIALVFFLMLSACGSSTPETPRHYIALLAAYEGEFNHLKNNISGLQIHSIETINGAKFHVGEAYGKDLLLFETGIGLVNAAMTLQLAVDHFAIDTILFSGVAGGVDPALAKGDLAVAGEWHYYEYGARFTADGEGGYRVPEFMQNRVSEDHLDGFFPYPKQVLRDGLDAPQMMPTFATDPSLLAYASTAAETIELVNAHGEPATILLNTVGGSGFAFNDDIKIRDFIREKWGTATVDMESAALAHVPGRTTFLSYKYGPLVT